MADIDVRIIPRFIVVIWGKITEGSGSFLNNRSMDNFLLNRMITPEADKPAGSGQDSRQGIVKEKQETIF
jgi:hypothetical protein